MAVPEEEEAVQAKFLQKQEEEEEVQAKFLQREADEEEEIQTQPEEEEETAQAKGDGGSSTAAPSVESGINSIRGGGQPLPESSRAFFEPRFGADFTGVRVHTGSRANHLARSINAKAFTLGKDLAFGSGEYQPGSTEGKRLLAHELTHVLQQTSTTSPDLSLCMGSVIQRIPKSPKDTPFEAVVNHPINVHIHAGPGENTKVLADLRHGHPVTILGGRAWIHVKTEYEGQEMEGYISHELLTKAVAALEKLDDALISGVTSNKLYLSLLEALKPAEKQKVLGSYRDKLIGVLNKGSMFSALEILGADCSTRIEWLEEKRVKLDRWTEAGWAGYKEKGGTCSLNPNLKKKVKNMFKCFVAFRLLKKAPVVATSACRTPEEAHKMSTAYHIYNEVVTLSDLQGYLSSGSGCTPSIDEVKDQAGNVWYKRGWTLKRTKKNAKYMWRSADKNPAYEGYEPDSPMRFPNSKKVLKSNHVKGQAIDVRPTWAKDPWDPAYKKIIDQYGLKRPIKKMLPPYTDEPWHFELK